MLVKYVNETDSNCPAHLCNSETYYFIIIKLILDCILLRSAKQSNLSLQLNMKVIITFIYSALIQYIVHISLESCSAIPFDQSHV